jgi:amino acid transporter
LLLALVAIAGVRESVALAGVITVLEVATLLVVAFAALPNLPLADAARKLWSFGVPGTSTAIAAGAFLAFFAFIGFEDIENMAEETRDASRSVPLAIVITLVISVSIYVLVAFVASAYPARGDLLVSKAPLALLFERSTGRSGTPIAAMASIAMINGILVQIVMASRVLYGMAKERLLPDWFSGLHPRRQTPVRATLLVTAAILVLALLVPLVSLAEWTSLIMLLIFTLVNVSLVVIGGRPDAQARLRRWRWWGVPGACIALALVAVQIGSWR